MESNNIFFYSKQHGFRKGVSTVTQLFETLPYCASEINSNGLIDFVSVDLTKAFDRVTHKKILYKMRALRVDIQIMRWVEACLRNRQRWVEISEERSLTSHVSSAVPQGSVLGLTLFLVYVNDMSLSVPLPMEIRLFADDYLLSYRVKSVSNQVLLNKSLITLEKWHDEFGMKMNLHKTVCHHKQKKAHLSYT